jgi:hypothetical protein
VVGNSLPAYSMANWLLEVLRLQEMAVGEPREEGIC